MFFFVSKLFISFLHFSFSFPPLAFYHHKFSYFLLKVLGWLKVPELDLYPPLLPLGDVMIPSPLGGGCPTLADWGDVMILDCSPGGALLSPPPPL